MERLISDFPTEEFSAVFGHEQLGDYYLENEVFEKAEAHFRVVTIITKTGNQEAGQVE